MKLKDTEETSFTLSAEEQESAMKARAEVTEETVEAAKQIVIEVLETGKPIAEVAEIHDVSPGEIKEALSEFAELACPELINYGTESYDEMKFADKYMRLMQNASYVVNQIRSLPKERLMDRISPLM